MSTTQPTVRMLQCSVDENDESYFRFLVDNKTVKYIVIDGGLYTPEDMTFAQVLIPMLPDFPAGDWNEGHISRDVKTGKPFFATALKNELPGIQSGWHTTSVDHLHLSIEKKLRSNVHEVVSPKHDGIVVAKFAIFDWEIAELDSEVAAYRWIEGTDIGPRFLGNLTEEGRPIGFIMEKIHDARHATPADLPLCRQTLSRLHKLGFLHGDVNKHNILIQGGRAVLIDFDFTKKNEDPVAFDREMKQMEEGLHDTSGKGGVVIITKDGVRETQP